MKRRKVRNLRVPFEQRRGAARKLVGQAVEFPYRFDHVAVVCINQMSSVVGVSGEVKLNHAFMRQRRDRLRVASPKAMEIP